jgi:hypothetical protein
MEYEHSRYTVLILMNVCTQQVPQIVTYRAFNILRSHVNVAIIAYRGARAFIELGTPLDQAQSGFRVSRNTCTSSRIRLASSVRKLARSYAVWYLLGKRVHLGHVQY